MPQGLPIPAGDADDVAPRRADVSTLYQAEFDKLRRFLTRRVRDAEEAADLAQDVFLRFVRIAPTTPIQTPEAYLRRIADNILRDRAERASTRLGQLSVPVEEGYDRSTDIDQHRDLEAREELERYRALLSRMKPKTLEIFILHRIEGLTYKQIGERLRMSEGGVKRHMIKAIAYVARARSRE
ncbi:RNA polymerase sigma factor [Flavisphingomonas formosensis]|uniref:RNA polymerase sigma factor n=1 Tax=Flavisphingomonas formosensis TaxID=861534 RepID=UPI0012FB0BB1|nr:RNA polymerase sigma factor [Sphingomonas formosensis]